MGWGDSSRKWDTKTNCMKGKNWDILNGELSSFLIMVDKMVPAVYMPTRLSILTWILLVLFYGTFRNGSRLLVYDRQYELLLKQVARG